MGSHGGDHVDWDQRDLHARPVAKTTVSQSHVDKCLVEDVVLADDSSSLSMGSNTVSRYFSNNRYLVLIVTIIIASAVALLIMGRSVWCECGYIKLWHGEVQSSENSQHISDWYSPSHVVHGIIFYGVLSLLLGKTSIGFRATVATLIEITWEIIENTNAMIERYRETTISLGYYGDSVVNSVADICMMLVGFFLASRLPVIVTISSAIAMEVIAALVIRDNLTLNIIMLIYPLDAIKTWQTGG